MAVAYCNEKGRYRIQIARVIDGERHRISRLLPRATTLEEAQRINDHLEASLVIRGALVATADGWTGYVGALYADRKSWIYTTLASIRNRARSNKRACTLTPEIIRTLLLRSRGRCELTGLQFATSSHDGRVRRPFFHSIDRIDATQGYVINNCRIVCVAANVAMMDWGEAVFEKIAVGLVMNKYVAVGFKFPSH